jgi:hypothetical protein
MEVFLNATKEIYVFTEKESVLLRHILQKAIDSENLTEKEEELAVDFQSYTS